MNEVKGTGRPAPQAAPQQRIIPEEKILARLGWYDVQLVDAREQLNNVLRNANELQFALSRTLEENQKLKERIVGLENTLKFSSPGEPENGGRNTEAPAQTEGQGQEVNAEATTAN